MRLVHLIALSFLIGFLFLISVSEARGVFTAHGQSMELSEAKSRECPGPVPEPSMTIITPPCNRETTVSTINATSSAGAIVKYNPTLRGEKVSATCLPSSGSMLPIGNNSITCTAIDKQGTMVMQKFVIRVAGDRTPPRIQVPNHNLIVANATNARGSVVDYNVSATDNVATNIHPICQPIASGQVFPIGNTTIVCTAKDNSNNTAKASFVVLVKNKEVVSTRSNGLILAVILIIIAGAIAAAIFIYRRSRQEKNSI